MQIRCNQSSSWQWPWVLFIIPGLPTVNWHYKLMWNRLHGSTWDNNFDLVSWTLQGPPLFTKYLDHKGMVIILYTCMSQAVLTYGMSLSPIQYLSLSAPYPVFKKHSGTLEKRKICRVFLRSELQVAIVFIDELSNHYPTSLCFCQQGWSSSAHIHDCPLFVL